ncbi:MAG: dihydropteroate synthase [Verrucomicrobiota bacterium]
MYLRARSHVLTFPRQPLVMGIVNLSVDSFSGDGLADPKAAFAQAQQAVADGADIIDIGAESARTNRGPISEQEEIDRLCEFVELWNTTHQQAILSINTWRPAVARAVLPVGGDLLNDIGALPTDENARICRETGAALLIMHSVGLPKVPHTHVGYGDVMDTIERFFEEKLAMVQAAELALESVVLDPGIDFAKQRADNLRIYAELKRLHRFGRPILLPVSRKTVIGEVLGIQDASQRDAGTVACVVQGLLNGAHIFRVHNVKAAVQTVRVIHAVQSAPEP